MNEIAKVFEGQEIRIFDEDGEPWFVLKDVCTALGLGSPHKVAERLEEDERNLIPVIDSIGRHQDTAIINESGLYSVILRSDKPEAQRFRKWVTSEVLPSIRKRGGYLSPNVDFSDPDKVMALVVAWKADREKLIAAESRIGRLVHNNRSYTSGEIAKEIGLCSAQALNQDLHERGIQYKDSKGTWLLYAEYAGKGFEVIKQTETPGGAVYNRQWTGLGRDWLLGLYASARAKEGTDE